MYVLELTEKTTENLEMIVMGEEEQMMNTVTEDGRRVAEQKASVEQRERLIDMARKGLEKIKEKLFGKINAQEQRRRQYQDCERHYS